MEILRDFCPHCSTRYKPPIPIFCKCGSFDLIPFPENFLIEPQTGQVSASEPNISNPPKAKIVIDPEILSKLKQPFAFITGRAGTGKTTVISQAAYDDPKYIELCSTTGIAAVNIGGRTLNSVLKYFNTKSLENIYRDGKLQWALRKLRFNKRILGIEEVSMLDKNQFDLIIAAVDEVNNDMTGRQIGVHLIGDFLQLPPVKADFCFKSENWERFENNTIQLDKIWRQENIEFIEAINLIRQGKGKDAVVQLQKCGIPFRNEIDKNFNGTTLISLNEKVDAYNTDRLNLIKQPLLRTVAKRRGKPLSEWANLIPDELRLKLGAYIMILSNDVPEFTYVNGDCGTIENYDLKSDKFTIKLKRNDSLVKIGRIVRQNLSDRNPSHDNFSGSFTPRVDQKTGDWIVGEISFHPLRLAYASSVHKSQGLSLDVVQIDTRPAFFGYPSMAYVAISRAKTPEGLVLIGKPNEIAEKIITNPECRKWV